MEPREEQNEASSESTEAQPRELARQASWALPETAPSPCNLLAWGRADLGQIGTGEEAATSAPISIEALQSKDIVYAAGSVYNSAFVTRAALTWQPISTPCHQSHAP